MVENRIGYARVSTKGQSLQSQLDALNEADVIRVFADTASGATQDRPEWQNCLDHLQPGNVLVIADMTRMGRSTEDLARIVTLLGDRGVVLKSLAEPWLDTSSSHGKLIFDMFAAVAEYERSRLVERTRQGLAAAKARGRVGGRPTVMTANKLATAKSMRAEKRSIHDIAETISVSPSTVIRALSGKTLARESG